MPSSPRFTAAISPSLRQLQGATCYTYLDTSWELCAAIFRAYTNLSVGPACRPTDRYAEQRSVGRSLRRMEREGCCTSSSHRGSMGAGWANHLGAHSLLYRPTDARWTEQPSADRSARRLESAGCCTPSSSRFMGTERAKFLCVHSLA